jgi:hypothetical protein
MAKIYEFKPREVSVPPLSRKFSYLELASIMLAHQQKPHLRLVEPDKSADEA